MLRMASLCTDCTTKVTQSSKAVQYQFSDWCTHVRCVDISDELYSLLIRYTRSNLSYSCNDSLTKIELVKVPMEKTVDTPVTIRRGHSHCKGSTSGDLVNKLVIHSISDYDLWTEIKRSPAKQKITPASGMQKTRSDKDSRERCVIIMNAVEPQASTPADRIMGDKEMLQIITSKLFDVGEKGMTVIIPSNWEKRM